MSIGPERSARIAATIESARSVWEATHDTDTLQQWLKDHNCHGVDAVLVTRGLLNCGVAEAGRGSSPPPAARPSSSSTTRSWKASRPPAKTSDSVGAARSSP